MQNDPRLMAALLAGLLVALALAVVAWRRYRRQRSAALREHFGSEYDVAVERHGDCVRAERELAARHKRVASLQIRLLSEEQGDRFAAAWNELQRQFVDDPSGAVHGADSLVEELISARGYPAADFEQRVADLSVEHAYVVKHYRSARALALASQTGEAGTEELRQAMVYYRALFNDLLQTRSELPRLSAAPA